MNLSDLPEPGTIVTLTIRVSDTETRTFHGQLGRVANYHVRTNEGRTNSFTFFPEEGDLFLSEFGPAEPCVEVRETTGTSIGGNVLAPTRDWFGKDLKVFVRVGADAVTITPVTAEGEAWIAANQSIDRRKTALLDRLRTLDPEVAKVADTLMWDIEREGYNEGQRSEWGAYR